MTILDVERLELFTFYKKVDIVKDQKTILTKFGNVCKLNHCVIAYKNACRIIELLKPDMVRVYKLFTAAVIFSLHLHPLNHGKAVGINSQIYLLPSQRAHYEDWLFTKRPRTQWFLEKVELQIVPSGQLLLAVRHANWPPLVAVTDLIDPDIAPVDHSRGTTLYMAPTGQLARYQGTWVVSQSHEQEAVGRSTFAKDVDRARQSRWMAKTRQWLVDHHNVTSAFEAGTIWLEVEIPVLSRSDDTKPQERELIWKRIYWPASLSYAFWERTGDMDEAVVSTADPFVVAKDWFLAGAAAARSATDQARLEQTSFQMDDRLFDDEVPFGSPQQYMNLPMQAFAQSQTVYPTPPDAMFTQPTPGLSVDGTVQTPATFSQVHTNNYNSSPLTMMTDSGTNNAVPQAITNFLQHNDEDDLFEDMDDEKLRHGSFGDEPNWDFFNPETLESENATNLDVPTQDADTVRDKSSRETAGGGVIQNLDSSDLEAPFIHDTASIPESSPIETMSSTDTATEPAQNVSRSELFAHATQTGFQTPYQYKKPRFEMEQSIIRQSLDEPAKRRRSSAYDIPPIQKTSRDQKYGKSGKYWFEPKTANDPLTINATAPPDPTFQSSSSSDISERSCASSKDQYSSEDDKSRVHPWTEYTPVSVMKQDNTEVNAVDVAVNDSDIDATLRVIATATGLEPFTTSLPSFVRSARSRMPSGTAAMVVQILTEQLTQSSLLTKHESFGLPNVQQTVSFDVSVDSAGSSGSLANASLADLASIHSSITNSKSSSKLLRLKHGKLRFKQAETDITAELPIVDFWEVLNLQPVSGSKDVLAMCVHPEGENYRLGCENFLRRMSETWSSCNLGVHLTTSLDATSPNGLVSWRSTADLYSICEQVGEAMAAAEIEDCTIVYMIIPDDDFSHCFNLCNAFVELFTTLEKSRQFETGDVALQLVPSSFVIGIDTLSIPPEQQFVDLALEVYQRLPPGLECPENTVWAPAFLLDAPVMRDLHFELTSEITTPLAKYGQCCHLAYCLSLDRRWLVAAWSDSIGAMTMSMSYCLLDDDGNTNHTRRDIFRHLCEASANLMGRQREKWWLAVVKVGLFETEEASEWSIATTQLSENQKQFSRVVLFNVELQPRLALQSSAFSTKQILQMTQHAPNALSTPVSTPQGASMTSPDHVVPVTPIGGSIFATSAQTPPDMNAELGNENEISLVDPMEDSWLVTLPFGLNQSHNFLEIRPALASGLLVKKTTSTGTSETQMATLGVNLVHLPRKGTAATPMPPHEREQVLEEILIQYRQLHTLAVARRCVSAQGNVVPIHVACAYRGASMLEKLL